MDHASTFHQTLGALQVEHEREVQFLHRQIDELRTQLCRGQNQVVTSGEVTDDNTQVQFTLDCAPPSASQIPCAPIPLPSYFNSSQSSLPSSTLSLTPVTPTPKTSTPQRSANTNTKTWFTKSMNILRISQHHACDSLEDGTPDGTYSLAKWRKFCESTEFDIFVSIIIVINTVLMAFQIQYDGLTIGHSMSYPGYQSPGSDVWPGAADFFNISEKIFVAIFTMELLFKLAIFRCGYFRQAWNWLDLMVVITGLLDIVSAAGLAIDPKFIRLVRLCKLARGLKAFKMGKFGDALQLIISSISASYSTLFWSLLVLIMFQCIAAMFMNQLLTSYFEDSNAEDVNKQQVFIYFGTFSRSFVSMFEVVLANWANPVRTLVANVGEAYGIALLLYRCTCGFSVLNVVSAVFIQQTFRVLSSHTDIMLMEKKRTENEFKRKLETLFKLADIPKDGIVAWAELESKLNMPEMRRLCFSLGIDHHDLEDIFHLLNRQGGMTTEEFLTAAHQIRRQARTIDVARLLVHSRKMGLQLNSLKEDVADVAKRCERLQKDITDHHIAFARAASI